MKSGITAALTAALRFGVRTPLAKLLMAGVSPQALGVGRIALSGFRHRFAELAVAEAPRFYRRR